MAADTLAALAQLLAPHGILAWLATYLVHSTLLLAAAWGASRWLRGRSLRLEERLWKAALVGGLLTATVQTGLAALPADPEPPAVVAATGVAAPAPPSAAWTAAPVVDTAARRAAAPDPRLRGLAGVLPGWQRMALAGWLLGGGLLAGGLAFAWLRLRLRLRGREDLAAAPAARLLDRLLARTTSRRRVRLTGTSALPVPVALGVGEREICLPRRVLRELDEPRQAGLLAHELAHLERRDPAWLLAALALQSVFFFQPLNRLARRRLEELAELQCDDWAVRATGDRVALARCLTEVASWLVADRGPLPVPGMARTRGRLTARVRRILEGDADEPGRRRWLPATAAALLLAGVVLVPGLAPATFADPEAPTAEGAQQPATPPASAEAATSDETAEADLDADDVYDDSERDDAVEVDADVDDDFDFDVDLDEEDFPDIEAISSQLADAMDAAEQAMPDEETMRDVQQRLEAAMETAMEAQREALEMRQEALAEARRAIEIHLAELPEQGELSAEERARVRSELDRELAKAREQMERAMRESGPALAEVERLNGELRGELAESLRQAHRELERAQRETRQRLEQETRVQREEVRREVEREVRQARRELERAHRELEENRRQLERERRQLEEERERLQQEHEQEHERAREREAPPPAS